MENGPPRQNAIGPSRTKQSASWLDFSPEGTHFPQVRLVAEHSRGSGLGQTGNGDGVGGSSRVWELLEQRHKFRGGRGTLIKKMPFVSGGGSAGWCGWNTGCHRRSVVDREKSGVEGPISARQEFVG